MRGDGIHLEVDIYATKQAHELINSVCYTPSSEPYRIHLLYKRGSLNRMVALHSFRLLWGCSSLAKHIRIVVSSETASVFVIGYKECRGKWIVLFGVEE
jgi:hypothetical protein